MIKNAKKIYIETYFIGKVSNKIIDDARFEKMVQGLASNCTRMIIPHKENNLKYAGEPWKLDILLSNNIGLQGNSSNYFFKEAKCSLRYTDCKPINFDTKGQKVEELVQRVEPLSGIDQINMMIDETEK